MDEEVEKGREGVRRGGGSAFAAATCLDIEIWSGHDAKCRKRGLKGSGGEVILAVTRCLDSGSGSGSGGGGDSSYEASISCPCWSEVWVGHETILVGSDLGQFPCIYLR